MSDIEHAIRKAAHEHVADMVSRIVEGMKSAAVRVVAKELIATLDDDERGSLACELLIVHAPGVVQAHDAAQLEAAELRARIAELERIPAQLRAEVVT